jgi:hypothetical protein
LPVKGGEKENKLRHSAVNYKNDCHRKIEKGGCI